MNARQRQEEIERDVQWLRQTCAPLKGDIHRPLLLTGDVLKTKLPLAPAKRPRALGSGRAPGWARPAVSAACAVVVVAGALLAVRGGLRLLPASGGAGSAGQISGQMLLSSAADAGAPAPAALEEAPTESAVAEGAVAQSAAVEDRAAAKEAGLGDGVLHVTAAADYGEIAGRIGAGEPESPPADAPVAGAGGEEGEMEAVPQMARALSSAMAVDYLPDPTGKNQFAADERLIYTVAYASAAREKSTLTLARREDMVVLSTLGLSDGYTGEVFVSGQSMAVLTSGIDALPGSSASVTVKVYDTEDPAAPSLQRTFIQEGDFVAARQLQDRLALVTVCQTDPAARADGGLTPHVSDSAGVGERALDPAEVLLPDGAGSGAYATVSLISLDGAAPIETRAVLGAEFVYVSERNLYTAYLSGDGTALLRLGLDGETLECDASSLLDAAVDSVQDFNESGGTLRVSASPPGSGSTSVFVLDDSLHVQSRADGLAQGEAWTETLWLGGAAYVRGSGAWHAVDLRDPAAAAPAGTVEQLELPVTGKDAGGLLLGLRYRPDGNALQLGLYDLTDPARPRVLDLVEWTDYVNWAGGVFDADEIAQDGATFAFTAWGGNPDPDTPEKGTSACFVYQVDNGLLRQTAMLQRSDTEPGGHQGAYRRAWIRDGVLYVMSSLSVTAVNLETMAPLGEIPLA